MKQIMDQKFQHESALLCAIRDEIGKVIVGLDGLIERLLICLLCDGHILIEGVPGLAKSLTVNTLARTLAVTFSRIQFTPDLLPGDVVGTLIYNQKTGEFSPHLGPIFANIVLADEINRSPAKVQSALLEAMQERQVTIGKKSYPLDDPFLVMATQNPIEQEGTYSLPEAQLDRFMFKVLISYPSLEEEHLIMKRMAASRPDLEVNAVASGEDIVQMRAVLDAIYTSEAIEKYILRLVDATRHPEHYELDMLKSYIAHGASPRASITMLKAARAHALLAGRDYVLPQDVKRVAPDILRHRVAITYKAEAEERDVNDIIELILNTVEVPLESSKQRTNEDEGGIGPNSNAESVRFG
ncbi:MAG: MoxR family ATPase, partial [Lentisphaerae bacterium]